MHFTVLTLFPEAFDSYLGASILKRAIDQKIITVDFLNIRDFAKNKHRQTEDTLYGGGAGLLMMPQPLFDCIKAAKKKNKGPVIFLTPQGQNFTHTYAKKLTKLEEIILLCGRYEGIDQRVRDELIDAEISVGKYVLTGGELPAMTIIDAISRLLPGTVHDYNSVLEDSFTRKLKGKKEYPHYTKPSNFRGHKVPEVLLSGHHAEIEKWREKRLK